MKTRLLARLLLITGSSLPLLAGCGDDTSDDGTTQTSQNAGGSQGAGNGGSAGSGAGSGGTGASAGNGGSAGSGAGSGGSDAGSGGSAAGSGGSNAGSSGSGGSAAGAGGSDAGAGGSDAGSGGTAGAGGSDAGSGGVGGSAAGNGGAGGNGCVEIEVCKDGQITTVCADPLADPKPFTDCGNGTCVDVDTMCPGPGGAGGSDAGAGGSDAGSGGSDGGSGGMAGAGGSSAGSGGSNAGAAGAGAGGSAAGTGGAAGSGGSGGSPGVPCKEGGACVEDAWCGDSDLGQVLHCQKGTYAKSDPGFADVKVCIERAPGEPCLEDGAIELQPAITAEYNASCLGVQGAAEPPVQKASNGVERCCYQVFAVCVGRPLFLGVEMRIAALLGGGGWA